MNKLILLIVLIGIHPTFSSDYQVYKVKKGDTISDLVDSRSEGVLYGKGKLVDKNLSVNRLDEKRAKKLKVGSYVILPKKKVVITDRIATSQSSNSKNGLLSSRISKHQNIEVSAKFSKKDLQFKNAGNVTIDENYEAGFKVIGNQKGHPMMGVTISNSSGIFFEEDEDRLVELKPSYGVQSSYYIMENKNFSLGPAVDVNEESSIDYRNSDYQIRRDQTLWVGASGMTTFYYKRFELNISGNIKQNAVSRRLTGSGRLHLIRANVAATVNLTRDYFVSASYDAETGGRSSRAVGFSLTYKM